MNEKGNEATKKGAGDHRKTQPYLDFPTKPVPGLTRQFASICAEVEIPEEELQVLTSLLRRIRIAAKEQNPEAKVTFFRHNYLKLLNAGSNQLLVYLSDLNYCSVCVEPMEVEQLFKGSQLIPLPQVQDVEAGLPFLDEQTGRIVGVVLAIHPDIEVEVVTCHLAKHLLRFDHRAKSLMALVHYWARQNGVRLSETDENSTASNIPDPAALEWLCLFFLGQRKVIPTLKTIRNYVKSRRDFLVEAVEGRTSSKASFSYHIGFEKEWRADKQKKMAKNPSKNYNMDVIKLAHAFFSFYGGNKLQGKLLNTINCKTTSIYSAIKQGLLIPNALEGGLKREINLLQPFNNRRFELNQEKFRSHVVPLMNLTARKLALYLKRKQITKDDTLFEVDLKSLFQCGRLEVSYGALREIGIFFKKAIPASLTTTSVLISSEKDVLNHNDKTQPMKTKMEEPKIKLSPPPPVVLSKENVSELSDQFAAIRKQVEIPDEEFQLVIDLLRRIEKIVQKTHKHFQLHMFRHHYLKLRNAGSNRLVLYMGNYLRPLNMKRRELEKLFDGSSIQPLGKGYWKNVELETPFIDEQSRLKFELETHLDQHYEVVSCHLAKHLLKFDPRAKSLLTLVHYWARDNRVTLSELEIPREEQNCNIPDPVALEWLCYFYLTMNKIIPSLNELRNRKLGRSLVHIEGSKKHQTTFPKDPEFIEKWRETKLNNLPYEGSNEYVLNVMQLAFGFFSFCSRNDLKGKVLVTNAGEVLDGMRMRSDGLAASEGEIFLMQPFVNRQFAICQEKFDYVVRPLMEKTAKRLDYYLKNMQKSEGGFIFEVDMKSIFQCGKDEVIYGILNKISSKTTQQADEINGLKVDLEHLNISTEKEHVIKPDFFLEQFKVLKKEVEIKEEEWNTLMDFKQKLTDLFESQGFPGCNLILFRNHYLKLQPFVSETVNIFFIDNPGLISEESSENETYSKVGTELEIPLFLFKQHYYHMATPSFRPEVQTCRMMEYYCTLNPLVKPLLTIIFYWAKLNNIKLGKQNSAKFTVGVAPDPALLEWLVIFFLCQKKIIPPPSEISGRYGGVEMLFDGVNIGVKTDPEYARKWWNQYEETDEELHFLNVFLLAQEFFYFWSEFRFKAMVRPIIIDLKNGNYFEKREVYENLDNTRRLSWITGISHPDLKLLDSEPIISKGFHSCDEVVTILHPLYIKHSFSFCWKSFLLSVCSKMGTTSKNLKKMLRARRNNSNSSEVPVSFSIDTVFKVD